MCEGKSNSARNATLSVIVMPETTKPVISLNGASTMTVECSTNFIDPGASATDNCSGSVAVTASGSVNTSVPGSYTITYTAADDSGNTAIRTRTVNIVDMTAPTLTLKAPVVLSSNSHKYSTFTISQMVASVTDGCNTTFVIGSVVIEKVTSDAADNAAGNSDDNTTNDIVIAADCKSVQLRSERDDNKNGRVYVVTLRVRDASGNITRAEFKVSVPKNKNSGPAIQDATALTVLSSCP